MEKWLKFQWETLFIAYFLFSFNIPKCFYGYTMCIKHIFMWQFMCLFWIFSFSIQYRRKQTLSALLAYITIGIFLDFFIAIFYFLPSSTKMQLQLLCMLLGILTANVVWMEIVQFCNCGTYLSFCPKCTEEKKFLIRKIY